MTADPTAQPSVTLADLPVGALARITAIAGLEPAYAAQLGRMGLIVGTQFEVVRRAPLGDPIEIRFRGYSLAIRPHEAADLRLERIKDA